MEDTGWQYSGNLWKMIDNIQWAFVMEKMLKENDPRLDDAMVNSEKMREAAKEFGKTRLAVAREMVRLGSAALEANKNQLLKAVSLAEEIGLKKDSDFFLIKDNCLTELEPEEIGEDGIGRTLTCIGFRPLPNDIAQKISRKYQLFK